MAKARFPESAWATSPSPQGRARRGSHQAGPAFCFITELEPFTEALKSIARLECVTFSKDDLATPTRAVALAAGGAVALELAGLKDPVAEKAKLETKLAKLEKELEPLRTRRLSELRHQGPRSRRGQAREAQRRVNPTPPIRGAGEGTPVRTGPRNSPGTVVGEGRSMAVPSPSRPLLL